MKSTTKIFANFMILLFLFAQTDAAAAAQTTKAAAAKKHAEQKTMTDETPVKCMPDAEMLKELQNKISVVESRKDWVKFNRQRPVVNRNQIRSAYIAVFKNKIEEVEYVLDVIVVHDAGTDKFYEIRGLEFPRPLENLVWKSNDVLMFDQWTNPRRGGRYAVDFKRGKLVDFGFIE